MSLDTTTQHELVDLLAPLLEREHERRGLLALAVGTDFPALRRIEWHGAVEPFILKMVGELTHSGEVTGKQALWRLLETARERVGTDCQARIDALEPIVNRLVAEAGAPECKRQPGASPLHIRVFLASPGDVADERALARRVVEQLPYDPLLRGDVTIEAVAWDQPGAGVPMLATKTPQAAIEAGQPKPSECDIVVVILWARMGRQLPPEYRKPDGTPYLSGTEWEYQDALQAAQRGRKPEILVYRRTGKFLLDVDDPQFDEKRKQREQVKAFFAAFNNPDGSIKRGCNDYAAPEDFRRQLELHLRSIIRRLLQDRNTAEVAPIAAARPVSPPPQWEGSPFPGLRAFTSDDAPIFFGRGRETDQLIRRLADADTRALVVVGASGSGKSSLVAAGLLPRLAANAIEGSKDWLLPYVLSSQECDGKQWARLRFTPAESSDNPFQALAQKLTPMLPDESMTSRKVAEQLEADPSAIAQLSGAVLQGAAAWVELLMFVDQLEELFSVVAERYRAPFIDLLTAAAQTPRLRMVATVRADFYHACLDWPKLSAIVGTGSVPLPAPGLAALFEMIVGPAARAGLAFEDGVPGRILDDIGLAPGSLALLAFALNELYRARTGEGRMARSAYDAFGGVRGAVSRRAEDTFAGLSLAAQPLLGNVFRELVEVNRRGVATRRRVARARLVSSAEAGELVDAFTDARLLVSDRSADGEAVVEVAHEALLREWPRLRAWVADTADDLRLWRQVETAADEWHRCGQEPTYRWPHERLGPVQRALERLGIDRASLAEPVKSFVRPEGERLLEELGRSETSHYRRCEIGDRLDRIGDLRPGVGLMSDKIPDIAWCEVPGGMVTLEGNAGAFQVERFFIAKYQVTYSQYRAFLDDPEGYGNERWWQGLKHEPVPGHQYRPVRNCPADNVSWYDAMAYCRWLSSQLGYDVSLPTEWQWQQAATGGHPDYEYPWGSDWVEGRANTNEGRLSRTTAVGVYTHGASAQDALDLSGNVWEWCLNRYREPRDVSPGGLGARVVRGGSWGRSQASARCAYRHYSVSDYRTYGTGFRLICLDAG